MTNLAPLLAVKTWQWVVIAIVAVIVLCVIMHFVNRAFRVNYNLNLFGGGLLMLVAIGACVGGYFLLKSDSKVIAFALFAVAALCVIITLVYDIKKCGGMGLVAFLCQILFSVGSLCLILEFKQNGYIRNSASEDRIVAKKRRQKGYDDYDGRY